MDTLKLDQLNTTPIEFISIVENYSVIHYDEFPILYIGNNKFGNKILGSLLEEDDNSSTFYKLHTIISNKEYHEFINGKITYLQILQNTRSTNLILADYSENICNAFQINFELIPQDYLPTENSFCPKFGEKASLDFSISLKGKLADINRAFAEEISKIQNNFSDFLEERLKNLKGLDINPKALLSPYTPGSFKINFEVEINRLNKKNKKSSDLFFDNSQFDKYLVEYIKYLSNSFIDDKHLFESIVEDVNYSKNFQDLEKNLLRLYQDAGKKIPDNLSYFLKEDIKSSSIKFEKIIEEVGENFESFSIFNNVDDFENSIAYADYTFSEEFQNTINDIEKTASDFYEDDENMMYEIYIYHLNTDTKTGNALIKDLETPEIMYKPKFKILGDGSLEQTKYTESLHLNKWISVKAKAKKIGNKFTSLKIEFED